MSVTSKVLDVYCDNLIAYYQFHQLHINVVGRHFVSDHELLGELYEDAQSHIDTIGELLRTMQERVPTKLADIIECSHIEEQDTDTLSSDEQLQLALETTLHLIECYQEVIFECGTDTDCAHISNFAQDRVLAHEKFAWKLRSTLE